MVNTCVANGAWVFKGLVTETKNPNPGWWNTPSACPTRNSATSPAHHPRPYHNISSWLCRRMQLLNWLIHVTNVRGALNHNIIKLIGPCVHSDWSKTHVLSEYKTWKKHVLLFFTILRLYHSKWRSQSCILHCDKTLPRFENTWEM